jgi:hypothetical protein
VHHEAAVGRLHGVGHLQEQVEPRVEVEGVGLGVLGDGEAVDVLHHQVGTAPLGDAPVEEAGDVRMVEAGQHLPLGAEARVGVVGVEATLQELDGHGLVVVPVVPLGAVDHAHPPTPISPVTRYAPMRAPPRMRTPARR